MTDEPSEPTDEPIELMLRPEATVYERMLVILGQLPAIGKSAYNEQQKFHYRAHDDVMAALNPLLAKYGVLVIPRVIERVEGTRTTRSNSTMYEVNLHVEFTFYGLAGDSIVASAWGEGTDLGDKSTNKAMTGAFKNVLAQAFALSTHELSDADAASPEPTTRGTAPAAPAPRRSRSDSPAPRDFDPGIDLRADAVQGDGFLTRLGNQLLAIEPTVDWSGSLQPIMYDKFGEASIAGLSDDQAAEWWRRTSNMAAKLLEGMEGDFPPLEHDKILEGIEWAYGMRVPELLPKQDPAAAETAAAAERDG